MPHALTPRQAYSITASPIQHLPFLLLFCSSSFNSHSHRSNSCSVHFQDAIGFSAGDFLSALELVGTVISALRSSAGSSSEYFAP
jgi:hypothetical protein